MSTYDERLEQRYAAALPKHVQSRYCFCTDCVEYRDSCGDGDDDYGEWLRAFPELAEDHPIVGYEIRAYWMERPVVCSLGPDRHAAGMLAYEIGPWTSKDTVIVSVEARRRK